MLVIGFVEVEYTVGEDDGTVSLTVAVLSGQLQDEALVTFYTGDQTAIGMHCLFCIYQTMHCVCVLYIPDSYMYASCVRVLYIPDSYRYVSCVFCIYVYIYTTLAHIASYDLFQMPATTAMSLQS